MARDKKVVHVLMVPFPTQGHVNGLLRFAQKLAAQAEDEKQEGRLLVSFAYPARLFALSGKGQRDRLHPSLRVDVLDDGLPTAEDQQPTDEQMGAAFEVIHQSLIGLLTNKLMPGEPGVPSVSCIVSDSFVPWTQDVASRFGLPRVEFWTSTATVYAMGLHLQEMTERGVLPVEDAVRHRWAPEAPPVIDFIPGLPPFPVTELPKEFLTETSSFRFQFMLAAFSRAREAHHILVHSVQELEPAVFESLQKEEGLPAYAIGPLLDLPPGPAKRTVDSQDPCLAWLDTQAPASVVYVALGSFATLTAEETRAMALGLEASGRPFLWVIRADAREAAAGALPEGFAGRVADGQRGGLIVAWAPQVAVLQHASVGGFLSHCGWNSTLESLWAGVPMVACPRAAEQRSNAKSLVDTWHVAVELPRNPEDGSFTQEAVCECVQQIMAADHPTRMRAREIKSRVRQAVAPGGSSHTNLANLVGRLKFELA